MSFRSYATWRAGDPAPENLSGYAQKVCRALFADGAAVVYVCRRAHNDSRSRYTPEPGEAIYVQATGGSWCKSRIIRRGRGVRHDASAQC